MKTRFLKKIIAIVLISSFFIGCDEGGAGGEEHGGHDEHGHDEHEEGGGTSVSISQRQAEAIDLQLGRIEKKSLGENVKVTGLLELFPQDRAEVSPYIGGNVTAINVIEGDEVTKGTILARMAHPDYIQMQQNLQQQSSQLEYLKLEYERKERLYNEKVSSGREYQKAKSEYSSTLASINGLKSKLQMLGLDTKRIIEGKIFPNIPIKSPIAGFVHLVNVNLGEFAGPQMGRKLVMFEITDNSKLHVDLRVYEKDIHKVKSGQKVYFTVANHPEKILEAIIHAVGKAFEEEPKSIHLHAEIENRDGDLLPGMYVEGRIVTNERLVYAVPEGSLFIEDEQTFIFVQSEGAEHEEHGHEHGHEDQHEEKEGEVHGEGHEEGGKDAGHAENLTFEKVAVNTGVRDLGLVEVKPLQTLPKNALVVMKGAYTLSSEMIKGELAHEH